MASFSREMTCLSVHNCYSTGNAFIQEGSVIFVVGVPLLLPACKSFLFSIPIFPLWSSLWSSL